MTVVPREVTAMSIAKTVESCLERHRVAYDVISHPRTQSSDATAKAVTVARRQIAKAVMLGDEQGYLMAVVPGDAHVDVERLSDRLGRRLRLVEQSTFAHLFTDCEFGAVPPLGPAYGIETIIDDRVLAQGRVCFVGGDHDELICVDREAFRLLTAGAHHATLGMVDEAAVGA